MTTKTPEDVLHDKSLKASILRNENEKGAYYTTTLARTYKDEQGNYRDTQSFSQGDLLRVAELARGAYGRVNELRREQAQERGNEGRENFRENRRLPQTKDQPRSR